MNFGAQILLNPHQWTGIVMQGMSEVDREARARAIEQTVKLQALATSFREYDETWKSPIRPLPCPGLYLKMPVLVPGLEHSEEILRRFLPDLKVDSLERYGVRVQDEEGGLELAGKVRPFLRAHRRAADS
jgi:hypothetical protein